MKDESVSERAGNYVALMTTPFGTRNAEGLCHQWRCRS